MSGLLAIAFVLGVPLLSVWLYGAQTRLEQWADKKHAMD